MEKNPVKSGIDIVADAAHSDRDIMGEFLALSSERSAGGILRCLATGTAIGILLLPDSSLSAVSVWLRMAGLLITGWLIAFTGWGADRLWYSTLGHMFPKPLEWYAYLTRVPFWFIAGGMGYTIGLLVSEKSGWLLAQDIPVRALFITGGFYGLTMQILLQARIYLFFRRNYNAEQNETERSSDDKDRTAQDN